MFKVVQIKASQDGTYFEGYYMVAHVEEVDNGKAKPYLVLDISDASGNISKAKMWNSSRSTYPALQPGLVIYAKGQVKFYKGDFGIILSQIETTIQQSSFNMEDFVPSFGEKSRVVAQSLIGKLVDKIPDQDYKRLALWTLGLQEGSPSDWNSFCNSTAAAGYHHAKLGGLLIHTLGVSTVAEGVCNMYNVPDRTKSRIIFLALVHDIQKRDEYQTIPFIKRNKDLVLDHVERGASYIELMNFLAGQVLGLEELLVCQKSLLLHHGQHSHYQLKEVYREQPPLEAKILHACDEIDASMYQILERDIEDTPSAELLYLKSVLREATSEGSSF
ncbi:hypothetical protein CEW46_21530 [Bacillus cereus]|nr:hypothetical protein CEW46_21530 [Bacillus cereus]